MLGSLKLTSDEEVSLVRVTAMCSEVIFHLNSSVAKQHNSFNVFAAMSPRPSLR
jgi:hypothetical protein